MSVLEDRYRSVLRLLPASYREVWEDEMVATFLESVRTDDAEESEYQADFGRPGLAEVMSVASLAVRLRLGGADAAPRSFVWGEAVRRVALVGLLAEAVLAAMLRAQDYWLAGAFSWPPVPGEALGLAGPLPTGVVGVLLGNSGLVWVVAYLAIVFGRRGWATLFASLGLAMPLIGVTHDVLVTGAPIMLWSVFSIATSLFLVLSLAAFHQDAPPVRRGPWLVAFGVGFVLSAVPQQVFLRQATSGGLLLDWAGVICIALVVAALVHLVRPRSAPWSIALALLAAIVLAQRLASMADLRPAGLARPEMVALAAGEAVAVLAVLVPLVVLAARALRGLPSAPAARGGHRAAAS